MEELIKLVAGKARIPEENAKIAVETVINFLKEKLPAPFDSKLDEIISGSSIDGLVKGLGGLLNK